MTSVKSPVNSLGSRARAVREKKGLDRRKVAEAAGMAYSTLADIENGNSHACTRIAQLATVLGVNSVWLETGKGTQELTAARSEAETDPQIEALLEAFRRLPPRDQARALLDMKHRADLADLDRNDADVVFRHARASDPPRTKKV